MIYVLPGMGADRRMYPAPWDTLPDCSFLNWPDYSGEQSLSEIAESVVRRHSIEEGAWLAGSSLGGMVATEIAMMVPLRGIILIGSARSPDEVSTLLRAVSPLIDLAPLPFIQQLAGKAPMDLMQMFKDSDPDFIRAMCRAIVNWKGIEKYVPIHRIHGRHDLVIPLPKHVEHVIDGGHLIAMTHAADCVTAVKNLLSSNP
ncbi:alpha/beta hydrolase [Oleiharenicola lentus]|jgi:pimeloyl-ACP methyl ester carboxylesterase|uniref:Alpha/beta hydrolase n=1 Tax=Oleiharenicola lentus TaxID=2508720 RepID=A0A4Q1CBF8_9BACT|nr:alpha/beta hydrolase [Oleiharenicola lentus]RXK56443.1 alpha/beta hydrolase [Oleiharenicola lentus]